MDDHRIAEEDVDDPSSGSGAEHEFEMTEGDETQMSQDNETQMTEGDMTEDDETHMTEGPDSHVLTSTRRHTHSQCQTRSQRSNKSKSTKSKLQSRRVESDLDEAMGESSQGLDDIDPDLVSPGQISQQEDSMPLTQKSGNRDQKWGGRGKRPRFSPDVSANNRGGSHERNVELDTEYDEDIVAGLMFEQPVSQALGRVSQRRSHGPFVDTDSVPPGSQGLDYADSEFQAHEPQAPDAEAPDATKLGQDPGASQSQRDQRQENRAHKEENFHDAFRRA